MPVSIIQVVTDDSFEKDVFGSKLPVLVQFWAPWSSRCKSMSQLVEEIAADFSGKLNVFKLNTDDNPDSASSAGVRGLPTLILYKDIHKSGVKKEVARVTELVSKPTLSTTISKHI